MFWHELWERFLAIFGIEINQRKEYQQNGLQISESIGIAIIGLTDQQKDELGEIKSVETSAIGHHFEIDDLLFTVEGREKLAHFKSPISGALLAVNPVIKNQPHDIRYASWLVKLRSAS
jgi:glycine cleavage system H lipoate-binding protein